MLRSTIRFTCQHLFVYAMIFMLFVSCQPSEKADPGWPAITRETKPWTRWWWQGNALTKEGITAEMEAYQKAGLGGLEITPIYGVLGYEDRFVDYLSPQWMELLLHTLKEAERLDLGIDMATGTGWPFGGPAVGSDDACKNLNYKIYEVKGGGRLQEKIEFIQQPYLRAVGNPVFEEGKKEPRLDAKKIDIKKLVEPIAANKNLQMLALDQVRFEKPLALKALMAYSDAGETVDLTGAVDPTGKLDWTAPSGNWKLYAVFEGWHGKMVERAGPGGEGNVIDHFSATALHHYLSRFDSAFAGKDVQSLRAFFNDSYEVDDASGAADWTPALFDEFKKRRGYDLKEHLPALFGKDTEEKNNRVLCDYRETIAELLLDNFTQPWKDWAYGKSAIIRNQAHGSPANILDLYAVVDIPEIEGIEPLRIKMASSAGNVTGKKLVSSESATWLNEHFESNLGDVKVALDRFMLNGVNHLFYHGTAYSPPGEAWPGWLFYAAVHFNPRNPLWNDFDALNQYASRCQSFLQNSTPDNDVLLYYPIYDRFSTPGAEMIEHFDGIGKQFEKTAFERGAKAMQANGYAFDYLSDKQLANIVLDEGDLRTEGNSSYKTLVIPHGRYIPLKTFQKALSLAEEGATIIAPEGLPASVAGYAEVDAHTKSFETLISTLGKGTSVGEGVTEMKIGKGRVLVGDSLATLLAHASVRKEPMVEKEIQFIRKKRDHDRTLYFIANNKNESFTGWLPLQVNDAAAVLYDPVTGELGAASVQENDAGMLEVYIQLAPRQSLIIETYGNEVTAPAFRYAIPAGPPIPVTGHWKITFASGGPELPPSVETDTLSSWTMFGEQHYPAFSGTAVYTISVARPDASSEGWLLDLGAVRESAEVFINSRPAGTLIGPSYQCYISPSLLQENNILEIHVSNLMANRISDMDRRNVFWRKFYNVNFPARKAENRKNGLFDASHWAPKPSGLLGPVQLIPVHQRP